MGAPAAMYERTSEGATPTASAAAQRRPARTRAHAGVPASAAQASHSGAASAKGAMLARVRTAAARATPASKGHPALTTAGLNLRVVSGPSGGSTPAMPAG